MVLWATWFIGSLTPSVAAQEPALHPGCGQGTLGAAAHRAGSEPLLPGTHQQKNSSNHPKWGTDAQKHWSWPMNSTWTPESILKAIPASKRDMLTCRVVLGWRLGAGGWVFFALCREWAEHVSVCSISDSFQRCLLGFSHLLGVLLQGQGHGHAPSASKDTRTMARWPGNEAGFEASHGDCAYRELEGHLRVLYARWVLSDTELLHRFGHISLHTDSTSCCSSSTDLSCHCIWRFLLCLLSKNNEIIFLDAISY